MLPARCHSDKLPPENTVAWFIILTAAPAVQRPSISSDASETNPILNYSIETFSPFTRDG